MSVGTPRVSVIVPVYNAWPNVEATIGSILAQTQPDIEAILVDDGSTDETGEHLDRYARERPELVRVVHIPRSGAPGRPRNVGLASARGTYVQFLDADDALAPIALERAVAMADQYRADIVIEKFASATIRRNQRLFGRNVGRCTLADRPEIVDSSLGPAKLFRRAFLTSNGITFPEGWRLMEDQFFSLKAYLRADAIAILADTACYFFRQRDDGAHLTAQPVDPATHFANLDRLISMVEAEAPAGGPRDHIVRRLIRVEVLGRIREDTYPEVADEYRAALFASAQAFVLSRGFEGPPVLGLGPVDRLRYASLLAGDRDHLLALDRMISSVEVGAVLDGARWRDGALVLRGRVELVDRRDGGPLELRRRDGRWLMVSRRDADDPRLLVDVSGEEASRVVSVTARSRETALEWQVAGRADGAPLPHADEAGARQPTVIPVSDRFTVVIDPMALGRTRAILDPGEWDILVRLRWPGISAIGPLTAIGRTGPMIGPALVGDPGRLVAPAFDEPGLRLVVAAPATTLAAAVPAEDVRVAGRGSRLVIVLPDIVSHRAAPVQVDMVVVAAHGDRALVGTLRPWLGMAVLEVEPDPSLIDLGPGPHVLALRAGPGDSAAVPIGQVSIGPAGGLRLAGARRIKPAEWWTIHVRYAAARTQEAGRAAILRSRRVLRPLARRLRRR